MSRFVIQYKDVLQKKQAQRLVVSLASFTSLEKIDDREKL